MRSHHLNTPERTPACSGDTGLISNAFLPFPSHLNYLNVRLKNVQVKKLRKNRTLTHKLPEPPYGRAVVPPPDGTPAFVVLVGETCRKTKCPETETKYARRNCEQAAIVTVEEAL
jgi:hypothetical protein